MWERWGKLLTRHEGKVSPLFLQLVVVEFTEELRLFVKLVKLSGQSMRPLTGVTEVVGCQAT